MNARHRLRRHLEVHLESHLDAPSDARDLPDHLEPALAAVRQGVAPYAVRLAREWRDPERALANLRGLLDRPVKPDPLVEPLLRWGVRLASDTEDEPLRCRFERALAAYQERFAAAHALSDLGDASTSRALASRKGLRPYAATDAVDGPVRISLLRLRDPVSVRFESTEADLSEIGDASQPYREIVLELDEDGAWLERLDPHDLTLRFVLDDRYVEVSTHEGDLFDVEVNPHERRVYLKVRTAPASWSEVESAVVMAPRSPSTP